VTVAAPAVVRAAAVILGLAAFRLAAADAPPAKPDEATAAYLAVRKQFIIATALPATRPEMRKEHAAFLRDVTAYLDGLPEGAVGHRVTALYMRGRLRLLNDDAPKAREDFAAALALHGTVEKGKAPPGMPTQGAIRLCRALTFVGDGVDAFVREIGDIPEGERVTGLAPLGGALLALAEEAERAGRLDEAIRVYHIIEQHRLWDPDRHQDPAKRIGLLEYQKKNQEGATP